MFDLPESGFSRSIQEHNVKRMVLADWIESSLLFVDSEISISDVLDVLMEKNIYADEDFGAEILEDAWSELHRRCRWMGKHCPFRIQGRLIERIVTAWDATPAHSFCLFLTLALYYRSSIAKWIKDNNGNYIDQGNLFEQLTIQSLQALGWETHHTGWASGIQTTNFTQIVSDVAGQLGERFVNTPLVQLYESANEKGLDLVCYKPFIDERGGKPIYLMQCASGGDWTNKLQTPNIETWKKLIQFASSPQRAFAMPFALEDDEFYRRCNDVDGMFIDRYRLLSPGADGSDWVSSDLKRDLIKWLTPRLSAIPTY